MTLIERIDSLSSRASQFSELDRRHAESQKLQQLLSKAQPLKESLGGEVQQMRLLQDEGIDSPIDGTNATATRARLERLMQRFSKQRSAESLTKRQDWTRLEEGIQATCRDVATALKAAWREFVNTAYSGESPDDLGRSLAGTERNIEQLALYRKAYQDLRAFVQTRPTERGDFDRVRELARQLSEIYQRFDFDVPEAVKRFLRAVVEGGASLDLLTEEVRNWLQQQNSSDHYRIVARTGSK